MGLLKSEPWLFLCWWIPTLGARDPARQLKVDWVKGKEYIFKSLEENVNFLLSHIEHVLVYWFISPSSACLSKWFTYFISSGNRKQSNRIWTFFFFFPKVSFLIYFKSKYTFIDFPPYNPFPKWKLSWCFLRLVTANNKVTHFTYHLICT